MDAYPLKSAARCPHCKIPMVPWKKDGTRYGNHLDKCPLNPNSATKAAPTPSVQKKPKKVKLLWVFERSRLKKIGELLSDVHPGEFVLICTHCKRSRLSVLPEGQQCDCGEWMLRAQLVVDEMKLDKESLPQGFFG